MSNFVQLAAEDCTYLLNLIAELDSSTPYTAKQRGYTIPKLEKIARDGRSARLAYQDVDYLLELIEDDDLPETEQQREMTRSVILEIQSLQNQRAEETRNISEQRELRKARRRPLEALQEHFQHVK